MADLLTAPTLSFDWEDKDASDDEDGLEAMCVCIYIYIYIHIDVGREGERDVCYTYIQLYM